MTLEDLKEIVHVSLIRPFPPLPWANFLIPTKIDDNKLESGKKVSFNGHLDTQNDQTLETSSKVINEIDGSYTPEIIGTTSDQIAQLPQTPLEDDDLSKVEVPKKSWAALAKSNINVNFVPQSTIVSVNAQEPSKITHSNCLN